MVMVWLGLVPEQEAMKGTPESRHQVRCSESNGRDRIRMGLFEDVNAGIMRVDCMFMDRSSNPSRNLSPKSIK
jgi:hypothetical protein